VLVALAVLLWQSLRSNAPLSEQSVESHGLAGVLPQWSVMDKAPTSIQVSLDRVPTRVEGDWLRALAHSGSKVLWSGDLPALMIAAQPVASPAGGMSVRVTAPTNANLVISDDVGVVDSLRVANAGAQLSLRSRTDRVFASVNGSEASVATTDSVRLGKVLVIGNAGWETKFVTAALEEEGWKVDAFIRVAPQVEVTQGAIASIDTSRYSAVVALDEAASVYADRIVQFARSGGGVVLTSASAAIDGLSALRSGAANRVSSEAAAIQASGSITLANIPLAPITGLVSDVVPLEKRGTGVAVAARRIVAGRAVQLGYEDTWRWRMAGAPDAVRDHRMWWSNLIASVAYAPRIQHTVNPTAEAAPLASFVAAVGPESRATTSINTTGNVQRWAVWLFLLISVVLLAEVASRRLRGAR
jgi:hypothetical protein